MFEEYRFENVLKSMRVKRGKMWTQARVAEQLGVSWRTYAAWETGENLPRRPDLHHIAALLALTESETETLFRAASQAAPVRQNCPFARNPFFTGREAELLQVQHLFEHSEHVAIMQPISVSGLGGIGKTALALEYAHRHYPGVYRSVLWVNAADRATLESGYLSLAHLLQLREREDANVERIVQAVKRWLEEYSQWLLILDNADDLLLLHSFLPSKPRGHILLTTRSQIVGGFATQLYVDAFDASSGQRFLLRRAGLRPGASAEQSMETEIDEQAATIVQLLGGHPLALDQAGAYLEETGASLADYHQLLLVEQGGLLQRRGWRGYEHPEAVATTLAISMKKACALHPACAEVLSFCALLHPDAIPEELLLAASGLHLNLLVFNDVMAALRNYSLIKRNSEYKTISLHRLVQAVIKDGIDEQDLRRWAERVVQACNAAFPEVAFEAWSRCERYLAHALVSTSWIQEDEVASALQASHLLRKAGNYLLERGQYERAQPLLQRALSIREQHLGASHPDTAQSLNNLAILYYYQGRYADAEPVLQRALKIREERLGEVDPDTAQSLNDLAALYHDLGRYQDAEPLYQRALKIYEERLGPTHPDTAINISNLALLYKTQGRYSEAEPLFQRALIICEEQLGASHPDTATNLNNLALLYKIQGRYSEAEPLYVRALTIREEQLGASHPDTAISLSNLGALYSAQGRYAQAEPLFQRALIICEEQLGASHPDTAISLSHLGTLYSAQGWYAQAEPLFQRALIIQEEQLGPAHPRTAQSLSHVAGSRVAQEQYGEAEPLLLRALSIYEQQFGPMHRDTARCLGILADLYQKQGKPAEAEPCLKRALSIYEQTLGETHPETKRLQQQYSARLDGDGSL